METESNDVQESSNVRRQKNKRPNDTAFQQQRLPAWQPLLTPVWVIATYLLIGIACIPIGVTLLNASKSVVEISERYDQKAPTGCTPGQADSCLTQLALKITKDMNPPVFFYYQLTNYYQNHRRYVASRSDYQMHDQPASITWSDCSPLEKDPQGHYVYPCGLMANSFFNDTFGAELLLTNGTQYTLGTQDSAPDNSTWQKNGIAWPSDLSKYIPIPEKEVQEFGWTQISPLSKQMLPNVSNEDFMVWMDPAALPTFRKLYRIINTKFSAGSILLINVSNVYPVASFNGQKAVVVSTASWMGGKNSFLGWAYIAVGIICITFSIVFFVKHWLSPRKLGDISELRLK